MQTVTSICRDYFHCLGQRLIKNNALFPDSAAEVAHEPRVRRRLAWIAEFEDYREKGHHSSERGARRERGREAATAITVHYRHLQKKGGRRHKEKREMTNPREREEWRPWPSSVVSVTYASLQPSLGALPLLPRSGSGGGIWQIKWSR